MEKVRNVALFFFVFSVVLMVYGFTFPYGVERSFFTSASNWPLNAMTAVLAWYIYQAVVRLERIEQRDHHEV